MAKQNLKRPTPQEIQVYKWIYLCDLSIKQTAHVMRISVYTVKEYLASLKKKRPDLFDTRGGKSKIVKFHETMSCRITRKF